MTDYEIGCAALAPEDVALIDLPQEAPLRSRMVITTRVPLWIAGPLFDTDYLCQKELAPGCHVLEFEHCLNELSRRQYLAWRLLSEEDAALSYSRRELGNVKGDAVE